jgi:hypothetical protein
MDYLFIGWFRLRLWRERIRRASLMSIATTQNTSQAEDQKSGHQSEKNDVDELKAFAHNLWFALV